MNVVLDDAVEINVKTSSRKQIGEFLNLFFALLCIALTVYIDFMQEGYCSRVIALR